MMMASRWIELVESIILYGRTKIYVLRNSVLAAVFVEVG